MKTFSKTAFFLLSVLVFSNVGMASLSDSKDILLVGWGGWRSCKPGVHNQYINIQFRNLVKNLKVNFPEKEVRFILSCADGIASVYGDRPLKYYTSEMRGGTYYEIAQNRFYQVIEKNRRADTAVYLVGHSHGGWYAMKAVESLAAPVAGLFTLEPISASACDSVTYMRNRTKKLRPWATHPMLACRQAPSDTRNQLIADKVEGSWLNFHLPSNQYRGDHFSGPAAAATNVAKRMDNTKEPHHVLGMDAYVWNSLCHEVSAQLGASAAQTNCPTPQVTRDGQFIRWVPDLN